MQPEIPLTLLARHEIMEMPRGGYGFGGLARRWCRSVVAVFMFVGDVVAEIKEKTGESV